MDHKGVEVTERDTEGVGTSEASPFFADQTRTFHALLGFDSNRRLFPSHNPRPPPDPNSLPPSCGCDLVLGAQA